METMRKRYLHYTARQHACAQGQKTHMYRLLDVTLITASGDVPGLANGRPRPLMRVDCDALLGSVISYIKAAENAYEG
jgi:hypothetical protein